MYLYQRRCISWNESRVGQGYGSVLSYLPTRKSDSLVSAFLHRVEYAKLISQSIISLLQTQASKEVHSNFSKVIKKFSKSSKSLFSKFSSVCIKVFNLKKIKCSKTYIFGYLAFKLSLHLEEGRVVLKMKNSTSGNERGPRKAAQYKRFHCKEFSEMEAGQI